MSTARCESINSVMRRKMRRCESSEKSSDAIFSAASGGAALSSRMAPRIVFSASILAGIWASSARSGKVAIPYQFRLSAGSAECSRIWKTRKSGHEILSAPDPGFGTQQAAEKGLIAEENGSDGVPQGLKPIDFIGFIGTTEVVPCYKARWREFFRSLYRPLLPPSKLHRANLDGGSR